MEKDGLILNNSSNISNYVQKLKHFQQELIPHVRALLSSKTNKSLLPIVDFFEYGLTKLSNIINDMETTVTKNELVNIESHLQNEKDKFIFDHHIDIMSLDFNSHGYSQEAIEVIEMKEKNVINPKYLNMKLGIEYFEKLEEIIFKPLIWAITSKSKEILFYENLLIVARKLEYFVREFFKIHLTSFYDIFARYQLTDNEWEGIRANMEVIVRIVFM